MKLKFKTISQRRKELEFWHTHFCWLPVRTEDKYWVWLEYVFRRAIYGVPGDTPVYVYYKHL